MTFASSSCCVLKSSHGPSIFGNGIETQRELYVSIMFLLVFACRETPGCLLFPDTKDSRFLFACTPVQEQDCRLASLRALPWVHALCKTMNIGFLFLTVFKVGQRRQTGTPLPVVEQGGCEWLRISSSQLLLVSLVKPDPTAMTLVFVML